MGHRVTCIEACGWLLINFTLAAKFPFLSNSALTATFFVNDAFKLYVVDSIN